MITYFDRHKIVFYSYTLIPKRTISPKLGMQMDQQKDNASPRSCVSSLSHLALFLRTQFSDIVHLL